MSSGITYNANGYIDFDGTQGGGQARNTPNITFVQGKTYKVVYEIKNYVSGAIKFRFQTGWNTIGQQQSGNGLKTEYIVCNDSSNNNFQFFNSPSFIGSIDNVSVKEVGQNWSFSNDVSVGNGVATFLDSGSNPNTSIKQSNILTSGKTYKLTFNVSRYVNGRIQVFVGSSASNHNIDISNGVGTYTLEATSTGTDLTIKRNGTYPNFDFDITNISVKEVGQNWTLGSDWSIGDNKAVRVGTSAGNLTQSPFTIGKTYKVSWEQSNGFIAVYGNTLSTLLSNTGDEGVHTVYFTPTSSDRLDFRSTDNDAEVTNISVKEVGQDWTLGTGWSIDQANSKAKSIQTGASNYLQQTISTLSNNKLYRVTFDLDIISSTTTTIGISNTGAFGQLSFSERFFTTSGTKTFDALYSDAYPNYIRFVGGAGTEFTITNISVKEITDDTDIPRINYSGFSYQDSLGSELVTNGDFATDSNWAKSSQSTISEGRANILSTDGSYQYIAQTSANYTSTQNKFVKITLDIVEINSGQLKAQFSGGASYNLPTSVGTHTIYVLNDGTTGTFNLARVGGVTDITIDNVSVKEYLGQEVVPDSGCGSWLLEPQSTNMVPYSSDFSQWVWGGNSNANNTTRVDNQSSLDGETNAALFTRNAGTNGWFSAVNLNVTLNQTYTYSLFVKKGTSSTIQLLNVSNSPQSIVTYNIDTDTFTTEQNATGSSVDYGNGWYRVAMTFEHLNASGTAAQIRHNLEDGESMYVFGSQFENLSYATSYIPTNGATNTRLQDLANNSGNSTLINSTEGVLYAEMAALAENEGNRCITISANSSNKVMLRFTTLNRVQVFVVSNGVLVSNELHTLTNITDFNKFAFKYKSGDNRLFVNGLKVDDNNDTFSFTSDLNKVNFNEDGGQNFYGKNKALAVYKEALTDANLRCLTYPNPVATTFDLDFDTIAEQFTFTRGSEATFVNEQGLIQSTNQIGSELVTNGDFSNGSANWNLSGSNISIANGKGISTGSNFGAQFKQTILQTNKTYKLTFDIVDYTSGAIGLTANYYGEQNVFNSIGTHTANFTSLNQTELRIYSENFIGSIDNISVKEVITATNTPRIDYSTGEAAFLLEPQSTNLITYSSDLSSLNSRSGAVVTSNEVISPSGDLDADKITFDGTLYGRVEQTIPATVGQPYTISLYLKNKDLSDVTQVWIGFSAASQGQFVTITDEWQRYDITVNADGASEYPRIQFSGTGSLYAWGFQTEQQSYATSYIPTDGASATRNQELCNNATPVINSEEGTLYAEISALADGTNQRWISIGSGSNANRVSVHFNATNRISCSVRGSSTAIYDANHNIGNQTNNSKVAIRYKDSDFAFFVNGVKVNSQTSGALNFNAALNTLSFDSADGGSKFIGKVKGLKYYPKALADVQLEDLTTI